MDGNLDILKNTNLFNSSFLLNNGSEVTKLKTKMPNIQILYHNYFGKGRTLWVRYDVI